MKGKKSCKDIEKHKSLPKQSIEIKMNCTNVYTVHLLFYIFLFDPIKIISIHIFCTYLKIFRAMHGVNNPSSNKLNYSNKINEVDYLFMLKLLSLDNISVKVVN